MYPRLQTVPKVPETVEEVYGLVSEILDELDRIDDTKIEQSQRLYFLANILGKTKVHGASEIGTKLAEAIEELEEMSKARTDNQFRRARKRRIKALNASDRAMSVFTARTTKKVSVDD